MWQMIGCALGSHLNQGINVPMTRRWQFLLVVLGGSAIGCALATGFEYGLNWRGHGTGDPRCVLSWRGYVEVHQLDSRAAEHVTCEYRPEISALFPRKS